MRDREPRVRDLPVAGVAAQLRDGLDQQEDPELAGMAVGQAAARGVQREVAARPDPAVGDPVEGLAAPAEAEPSSVSATVIVNES